MVFTGIILFVFSVISGLFSMQTPWLSNLAVFLFGWAVAFIMIGMIPKADRVDSSSKTE